MVLDLPMPMTGDRTSFSEILIDDLSKQPFANLPVTMTFSATDATGQTGTAAPWPLCFPANAFSIPWRRP